MTTANYSLYRVRPNDVTYATDDNVLQLDNMELVDNYSNLSSAYAARDAGRHTAPEFRYFIRDNGLGAFVDRKVSHKNSKVGGRMTLKEMQDILANPNKNRKV